MDKEPRQILPPGDDTQNSDIDSLITAEHYQTGQFNSYDYNESLFDRVTSALADNKLLLIPIVAVPVVLIGLALGVNGTNSNEQTDQETISLTEQALDSDDSTRPVSINSVGDEEGNNIISPSTNNQTQPTTNSNASSSTSTPNPTNNNSRPSDVQGPISPSRDPELDVCLNLFGIQTTVPNNLTRDSKGNCINPATQDVCPNLLGIQFTVPAGKAKDATGNCVELVQDLCKNITGVQAAVPTNYIRGSDGNCTLDLCVNISGLQTTVPTNYVRSTSGSCTIKQVVVPASKINIRPWKVTLPVGSGGDPIEQPASKLYSPWYTKISTGYQMYVDSARATARTTNSPNIRTELREMQSSDPSKVAKWYPSSGVHQLLVRLKVTKNTGKGTVVIAQIHGADDDVSVFRLERISSTHAKLWFTRGDTSHGFDPHINVALNQVITVGYKVQANKIYYYYSPTGSKTPKIIHSWAPSGEVASDFRGGSYFKTGNYQQSSGYSGRSETNVVVIGLGLSHNSTLPDIGGN